MDRELYVNYKINNDKTVLEVSVLEVVNNTLCSKTKSYDVIKCDDKMTLYNYMLDDFDAEYDDTLSLMLDKMLDKIIDENE